MKLEEMLVIDKFGVKSSWHSCLKQMLLSTISLIYYFFLLNAKKIRHSLINIVCSKRRA